MPRKKNFYVVVNDHDNNLFHITNTPVSDDTPWINVVVEAQKQGRNVNCFTIELDNDINNFIFEHRTQTGFNYSPEPFPGELIQNNMAYLSKLPNYAKDIDRKRAIQIFCRECRKSRWAELNQNYPGKEVLKQAEFGEYIAHCKFCGQQALDNYNWYTR